MEVELRPALFLTLVAAATFLAPGMPADQVSMKNGDRLSGTIVKSDGKTLTMKTDFAGMVQIQWEAVDAISSAEPLNLVLKDGQKLVGRVSTEEKRLEVATEEAGRVVASLEAIEQIRSKEEEAAHLETLRRLREPGLLDLWAGYVDLGLSSAQGNAETSTFNLGANAVRTSSRDKISVSFTSLRSRGSTKVGSVTTANATRGGLKYNLNIRKGASAFGFTDLEYDEFQSLDLRFVAGGGLGYQVVNTEQATLDLSLGGSLNKEFFATGLARSSGEVLLGEEFSRRIWGVTTLRQKLAVYPNLTETGAYRINFDVSAVTNLSRWLAWQLTLSDRFLSNPIPGREKNDVLFTTGVRVTFAK